MTRPETSANRYYSDNQINVLHVKGRLRWGNCKETARQAWVYWHSRTNYENAEWPRVRAEYRVAQQLSHRKRDSLMLWAFMPPPS